MLPPMKAMTKEDQMASRLNPYISFDGTAKPAMEFYKDVFGGNLTLTTFGETGAAGQPHADQIMHSQLETGSGYTLMASDIPPGMEHHGGDTITICLSGDDGEELRRYWGKLSEGGTVAIPMEKQVWGDEFGMCVDKFGVTWQVNIGQAQES
jgi:PhnB protein